MKYYVLHITEVDGVETKSVFDFETRDRAEIEFHTNVAYDMNMETITKFICLVINSEGNVEMSRVFTRFVEE